MTNAADKPELPAVTPRSTFKDSRERMSGYAHLRVFESDFDRSQTQVRTAASTWIVAALGALGFIGSRPPGPLFTSASWQSVAGTVCVLAVVGLLLLWLLDQGVYQKLLHSVFSYGLMVESLNPDLPQVRSVLYDSNTNVSTYISAFYLTPMALFTTIVALLTCQTLKFWPAACTIACLVIMARVFFAMKTWHSEFRSSVCALKNGTGKDRRVGALRKGNDED